MSSINHFMYSFELTSSKLGRIYSNALVCFRSGEAFYFDEESIQKSCIILVAARRYPDIANFAADSSAQYVQICKYNSIQYVFINLLKRM